MMARPRFSGSVFKRGDVYWIQYYDDAGERQRESTKGVSSKKAEKLLQQRLGEAATGTLPPKGGRVLVMELADDLLAAFRSERIPGLKSLDDSERRWNLHLKPFFGHMRAARVGTDQLNAYVTKRQAEGSASANTNRELSFLRRAFQIGLEASPPKVRFIPPFPRLTESNIRTGFLTDAQYDRLAQECAKQGVWLRGLFAIGATFAWRRGEVINLRVRQLDMAAKVIRLETGTTKNNQGRVVRMTAEVAALMEALIAGKADDDRVFTRSDGKPVRDFRGAWENACKAAGVPNLLFHDLRRTGARNLRRLGVSESTAMRIGGWKTASVFRRYDIVDEADLADAAQRLDEKARISEDGHRTATVQAETATAKAPKSVQ
jgi:integrase